MDLPSKSLLFLIEAVEYRITWYDRELKRTDLSEDERSELTNDHGYFGSILELLKIEEAKSVGHSNR